MDYENFKKEYNTFKEWNTDEDIFKLDSPFMSYPLPGAASPDIISFSKLEGKHATNDAWLNLGRAEDRVNSPAHYTRGSQEAIDTIEEAIQDAPTPTEGMLQGQVLKYLLRLWLKDNPAEDAKKAQWYLTRLIAKLESAR